MGALSEHKTSLKFAHPDAKSQAEAIYPTVETSCDAFCNPVGKRQSAEAPLIPET
jgi:hypothetical protein